MTAGRRRGIALRLYRGSHRPSVHRWRVDELSELVAAAAERTRREHLRSLRRPFNPGPIPLGSVLHNVRFYGLPAGVRNATLAIADSGDVLTIDALTGPREEFERDWHARSAEFEAAIRDGGGYVDGGRIEIAGRPWSPGQPVRIEGGWSGS